MTARRTVVNPPAAMGEENDAILLKSQLTIRRELNPHFTTAPSGPHVPHAPTTSLSSLLLPPVSSLVHEKTPVEEEDDDEDEISDGSEKGCWERPGTVVAKRNARERTRVHTVNQAFALLKNHLPSLRSHTKRVSKLKVLRAAISYIDGLIDLLKTADPHLNVRRLIPPPKQHHTAHTTHASHNATTTALADRPLGGTQLPYVNVQSLLDCQQYIYPPPQTQSTSLSINPFLLPTNYQHH